MRENHWNDQNELLLAQWGERASVLRILHNEASYKYRALALFVTIPTIVLSTLAATLQMRLSTDNALPRETMETLLSAINMVIAMVTGIGSLMRFHERAELHKTVSNQFGNFYRNVSCDLAFPRHERDDPNELLKIFKRQYDGLLEGMPDLPQTLIKKFKTKHKTKQMQIELPDICNGLDKIKICKTLSFDTTSSVTHFEENLDTQI